MREFLRRLGVDRAVGYTIVNRVWQLGAGALTLVLISRCLTRVEQGFFYTFNSLLGMQVFFELGLTTVIQQFASHERAALRTDECGRLVGDVRAKSRLGSLLCITVKWYAIAVICMVVVVMVAGFLFFASSPHPGRVAWRSAWAFTVAFTGITLFSSTLFSYLEGCGLIAKVAKVRTIQAILANGLLWAALLAHARLAGAAFYAAGSAAVAAWWLWARQRRLLGDLVTSVGESTVRWRTEVWPFQWRIGLSWLSGYFIFQIFNPLLFRTRGPIEAGQMGMSLSIATAVSSIAISWLNARAPHFGALVARRDYGELDRVFFRALWQSFAVVASLALLVWTLVLAGNLHGMQWMARLLPPTPFGLLLLTIVVNHIVFGEALYLRAHKQEPFLWTAVALGCLNALFAVLLARPYGAAGLCASYLSLSVTVGLGVGSWIFATKRRLWHAGADPCT